MDKRQIIELVTHEVRKVLEENGLSLPHEKPQQSKINEEFGIIEAMKTETSARIGVGKAGARLKTDTMLSLRADYACAKDAVSHKVDDAVLSDLGLFSISSKCKSLAEHLTRPDLGRQLNEEAEALLKERCVPNPQVQIYVSDGLSGAAVNANAKDMLPVMIDGLKDYGVQVGTPFYLQYGRVPAMDRISELLNAQLTCVLIGERPGLAAADSMSAYLTYKAKPGIPESKRTVVSNIHKEGIQSVEAGAYVAEIIVKILEAKASGVELKL